MRFIPKTIEERGGLKIHLTSLGIDYDLFMDQRKKLIHKDGTPNKKALAQAIGGAHTRSITKWLIQAKKEEKANG